TVRLSRPADVVRTQWQGVLDVTDGLAFAERIGFRYCTHKTARLTAAAAWWRMKRTVLTQRREVARRALAQVGSGTHHSGPVSVWRPAVNTAYDSFASETPVLNEYFASFRGNDHLSRQHLESAIEGPMAPSVRRTHRK